MIAMAISCKPALLICDEPTTALDVRVQKTILDLLKDLAETENMGMIFITHDLGLVADMADRAAGYVPRQVVETGPVKHCFQILSMLIRADYCFAGPPFIKKGKDCRWLPIF